MKEAITGMPAGWSDDIRITNFSNNDIKVAISVNDDDVYLVWERTVVLAADYEVFFVKSNDSGQSWNVPTQISNSGIFATSPAIDVNNSNIHVTWSDWKATTWEIFYRNSTDGGQTWNPEKRLSIDDGERSQAPKIVVSEDGLSIHVVWVDSRFFFSPNWNAEIYYVRSTDGGITWDDGLGNVGQERRLTNAIYGSGPNGIVTNGSNVHMVFSDDRNSPGNFEVFYKRSVDNGATWDDGLGNIDQDRKLTTNGTASHGPGAIAVNGSAIHVVWVDEVVPGPFYYLYYRNSTDNGATWSPIKLLTGPSAYIDEPSLAVYGNNLNLVWMDRRDDGSTTEIYYKNSTDGGISWSGDIRLTYNESYDSSWPRIALNNSTVHVAWFDDRDGNDEIYYKRFPDFPDISLPDINHIPIPSANIGQTINITANITDDVVVNLVFLNYTGVNGTNYNVSMNKWDGKYSYDIPGQANIGIVDYFIWANDTSDNDNMTTISQIQINDITAPEIYPAPITSANASDTINITANVTDDVAVDSVFLNYTGINGTNYNVSMTQWNGNWSYEIPAQAINGTVYYFVWANDTSGNANMTEVYQIQIFDNINPVADVGLDQSVDEDDVVNFDASGSTDNSGVIAYYNWSFGDGSFDYGTNVTPSHVYTNAGMYIVTLNVSDAAGNWDVDTCLIFVNNVVPTADAVGNQLVNEGEVVLFDGSDSTDTPSDLLNLIYTWYFGDGDSDTGINVNHSYADDGIYNATLIVTDDNGFVDSDTTTVTVNNVAPTIEPVGNQTIFEDSLFTIKINATDVPADTLTFSDNTTLFDINQITGMIEFTPTNDDVGNHSVNITVVDDDGGVNYTIFNITVLNTNDAPVIETISQQSAIEDVEFTLYIVAQDVDVDDVLTYSLTTYPTGMSIDGTTGVISWTPANENFGMHTVTVKVEDNIGAFDTDTFTIVVSSVNDAPTIVSNILANATEDVFYMAYILVNDVDAGDSLIYSLDTYPAFLIIDSITGLIFGTPSNDDVGHHDIIVNVTDGDVFVTKTFSLNVVNVNDVPVIASSPILTVDVGVEYSYDVVASDEDNDVLTYSLVEGPEGMTINGTKIIWIPTNEQQGKSYQVVVEVTDGEITTTQSFVVSVGEIPEGANVWLPLLLGLVGGLIGAVVVGWVMKGRKKEEIE